MMALRGEERACLLMQGERLSVGSRSALLAAEHDQPKRSLAYQDR